MKPELPPAKPPTPAPTLLTYGFFLASLMGLILQPGHLRKRNVFRALRCAHDGSEIFGRHKALRYSREEKARKNCECDVHGERPNRWRRLKVSVRS